MQVEENHLAYSGYNVAIKLNKLLKVNLKGIENHIKMQKNRKKALKKNDTNNRTNKEIRAHYKEEYQHNVKNTISLLLEQYQNIQKMLNTIKVTRNNNTNNI